jgi:hypothetical protein
MKKIRSTGITGQRGVNTVERVVLEMGSLWHPTGGLEAGTDGFIEFRDPDTEEVLNLLLPVQSKATGVRFSSETEASLAYVCEKEDIDYWMQGNRPMVVVVSRPDTGEAYWVSIKDYFHDPKVRQSRRVVFDKVRDRFDVAARARLLALATPPDAGMYSAPVRRHERITSNLLRITRLPARLYHGFTDCGSGGEVRKRLQQQRAVGVDEWTTRGRRIVSVHNLAEGPWRSICDPGTVEEFDVEQWSLSADHDTRSDFTDLLHQCLWARLTPMHVRYDREMRHFFYTATPDLSPRTVAYRSYTREARSTVFRGYPRKDDGDVMSYYRHHAFEARFREYDSEWCLQIDPTYRYTTDGRQLDRFGSDRLSKMRKLAKNPAVRGHVLMWAALLSDPASGDLFTVPAYPHLGFGDLVSFELPVGIDEARWLESDENAEALTSADESEELELFSSAEAG